MGLTSSEQNREEHEEDDLTMKKMMLTMIVMITEIEIKLNSYLHWLFLAWKLATNKNTSELRPISGNEE